MFQQMTRIGSYSLPVDVVVFNALGKEPVNKYVCASRPAAPAKDEDENIDFFGSEDEGEAEKRRAERVAKKKTAQSIIILDINIAADGLVWRTSKFMPIVHGIKKLKILCVIEDDNIDTQFLEDEISKFDDYVQSIDILALNKLSNLCLSEFCYSMLEISKKKF
ncbi:unnamed protein product [Schistocephalus solidus]|uniref:Translation elongation factor EF1B beta/delta subunit guanine nucleotide exchange domain-containing protein n=1 Tax=Schistocephalus solidus TaxID=70667 RepID=A0A3P7D0U3_SCHSO|nr:unnamed protein product [Schistocephalus solidus]